MEGAGGLKSWYIPGTNGGAKTIYWCVPRAITLERVDASCASAPGTFDLGPSTDPNGIISAGVPGTTTTAGTFNAADFNGALCDQVSPYHLAKNTMVELTLSASSQVDLDITLWFEEG
jgi:hypothetical protein